MPKLTIQGGDGMPCQTGAEPTQPKFMALLEATSEIKSVISHLNELAHSIGLGLVPEPAVNEKVQERPEPSLVATLNDLPEDIRMSCQDAHAVISRIADALN